LKIPKMHWGTMLTIAGFFAYFLGRFVNIFADYDLWGYLAFGRIFWENGFPYRDVFSYVPTNNIWVYHEWLTSVIFFPIYERFGSEGLQLLRYAIIMATLAFIVIAATRRGGNILATGIALFLAGNGLTYGYAPVRAQVFTYLFFALFIFILERYKRENKPYILLCLPLLEIVWCNVHGGFVAGLGLIGLYALGEGLSRRPITPYLKIALVTVLATLVNPYGFSYWIFIIQAVTLPRPDITEWMSVPSAIASGNYRDEAILFAALSLITVFLIVRSGKKNLTDILVLAVTAFLGFKSIRHIILFFLAFGAYVPVLITNYMDSLKRDPKVASTLNRVRKPVLLLFSLVFLCLAALSFRHFIYSPRSALITPVHSYPIRALEWIEANRWQGNIIPNFEWGEYVIWRTYPRCRVSMDGRLETVYSTELQREYFDFLHGRADWQIFLKKYAHDMVLIRKGSRTDSLMREQPDWRLAYEDRLSVIFLRTASQITR
jgi:hypothetical protein